MSTHRFFHNGFHGRALLAVRGPAQLPADRLIHVSAAVARRLNRAVCSGGDCRCGEMVAFLPDWAGEDWVLAVPEGGEIRGHYPRQ